MVAMGNVLTLFAICAGVFPSESFFQGYGAVGYFYSLSGVALIAIILFTVVLSHQDSSTFLVPHESTVSSTAQNPTDVISSIL